MEKKHYDVFVIGSGIAGQTAAKICRENKMSVAIADNREYGGTCSNRGCDPKKVLLQFADLMHTSKNLKNLGVAALPSIDWEMVQKFKSQFIAQVPINTEKNLKALNIDMYHQSPIFQSENEILVEGKTITADNFVIATGNVPRDLQINGSEHCKISDDILNLKEIPESALFIGSGYVAMEFTYMLATLGCKVSILEIGGEALSNFDQFLVEKLVKKLEDSGVEFIFNANAESVEKLQKNYRTTYQQKGKSKEIISSMVFNTAGRVASISDLKLENAKVESSEKGIVVNEYLQSDSNPKVFACGDVSNKSLPLTPLSGLQGYIVGNNILKPKSKVFDVPCVPSVVFTNPNISTVGYSEEQAVSKFKDVKIYQGDASDWFNAEKQNEDIYAYKILVNARTNEILGAHLLSSQANETINIFATAISQKMTTDQFKKLIFTYPSYSQDLKKMLSDD
ncbi:glutathione reductase (NADPH) [Flavobacteriaceae bacterium MAR_2010_188]|nr:glutathione reductase (NADPH) [Flavobacteriaceae bacterium MAR_2010_188]